MTFCVKNKLRQKLITYFSLLIWRTESPMNSKDICYTLVDSIIFSFDILGVSDYSDKEELNNPLRSSNVLSDTDESE